MGFSKRTHSSHMRLCFSRVSFREAIRYSILLTSLILESNSDNEGGSLCFHFKATKQQQLVHVTKVFWTFQRERDRWETQQKGLRIKGHFSIKDGLEKGMYHLPIGNDQRAGPIDMKQHPPIFTASPTARVSRWIYGVEQIRGLIPMKQNLILILFIERANRAPRGLRPYELPRMWRQVHTQGPLPFVHICMTRSIWR